jgi:hypothetical protein
MASFGAITAVALGAGLLVSGCGGGSKNADNCGAAAFDRADAAVVAKAYDAGKIGTRATVERKLGGAAFFTSDDHLKPFLKLTSVQQGQFDDWMRHDPAVLGATLDEQNAIATRISQRCKS